MIREDFLQQSAFSDIDAYSSLNKQHKMLSAIMKFHERSSAALDAGVELKAIKGLKVIGEIARMKEIPEHEFDKKIGAVYANIDSQFSSLTKGMGK